MIRRVLLLVLLPLICSAIYVTTNTTRHRKRQREPETPAEWTEPDGFWSSLLEEWAINPTTSSREGKVLQVEQRYIPTSGYLITKRVGDSSVELDPHLRPPNNGLPHSLRQNFNNGNNQQQYRPREVSETDLYLLGAIEKLVYRVDYLESRVRRTEQVVYYLMEGNKQQKEEKEPETNTCPKNFVRMGENCYHIDMDRQVNWKSANTMCKSMGAHLAEFETIIENHDVMNEIKINPQYKTKDFWVGGLNPGLLWIWSSSARPVNPKTNLTSIASSVNNNSTAPDLQSKISSSGSNSHKDNGNETSNLIEIKGSGRCLKVSYERNHSRYAYMGAECTSRLNYICELLDNSLDNEISRIARKLDIK